MQTIESRWVGPAKAGAGSLLERVMAARQYPSDARGRDVLHSPRLGLLHLPRTLPGATEVAERLVDAVRAGRRVAIYGDYDADGITATAILWRTIRAARPDAALSWYVPDRFEEGYGLNEGALEWLAGDGVQVVVTVDCGASAVGPSRRARELGLELLVTDHHHVPEGSIAEAAAIAHPALPGRARAPFAELCGAAVAFKVASEFARTWCGGENVAAVLKEALAACVPLVAVGSVADVVPLVDENRVFVARGLETIHATAVPGLRALLDDADLAKGKRVQSSDVGFRVGPRLNAVGRLGHAREAVELLVTSDPARARALAKTLSEVNERRRAMDTEHYAQARERIEGDGDQMVAICEAKRRGDTEPVISRFSMADAKRAGLAGKSGPWSQYPRRMLQMRARGFCLRDAFPDILRGVITAEEAQDYPTPEPTVAATPRPPVEVRPKFDTATPSPLMEDPAAKARLAINRAKSLEECDKLRRLIEQRTTDGVFTQEQHDELVGLLHGKAELLIGDNGQEFTHESAEHEVTA